MLNHFVPFTQVDTSRMLAYVDSMEEIVEALDEGVIPNNADYTLDDLAAYIRSLVEGQRQTESFVKPGCWCVVTLDDFMPSDARVDFVFRPTYAAVATLSRTLFDYPVIALRTKRFLSTLKNGLVFATHRALAGHGFDADQGAIDALRILSMGKVPLLLDRHPKLCPALHRIILGVAKEMQRRLDTGTAVGVWGEDLAAGFRSAIETLQFVNNQAFMQSIAEAKQDPELIKRTEWKW
jgi:hypothetical protein